MSEELSQTSNRPPNGDAKPPSDVIIDDEPSKEELTVGEAVVNGNVRVVCSTSTDALEAYLTVRTPPNSSVSIDMLREALEKEKVIEGIKEDVLEELSQARGKRGVPVLVAQGKLPGTGTDAKVEYFFDTDPKPVMQEEKDGRVDFRESNIIQQVSEGQRLAVKTPAMPGEPGITVTGVEVTGKPGTDTPLLRGRGTEFEDEEKLQLKAIRPGSAKVKRNGEVEVSDRHIIEGDVDFESGNVRFNGSVIIEGSVRAGFEVTATRDVEVKGIVEDAKIHCGGNLLLRGGFVGQGKGIVRAAGEVHIKFLENQTVHANGDVYIAEEIVHANVNAGGKLIVKFGKGAIIGGHVVARKGIQAKIFGNIHYVKTVLTAGRDERLDDHLEKLNNLLERKKEMKTRVQEAVNHYVQNKYKDAASFSQTDEEHLQYLYRVMANYDEWFGILAEKQAGLIEQKTALHDETMIIAAQRAFPGVVVEIENLQRKLDKDYNSVAFKIRDQVLTALRPVAGEYKPIDEEPK